MSTVETDMGNLALLDDRAAEKMESYIKRRSPSILAVLLVDMLRDNDWKPEDIYFLGSEIMNESGAMDR
jgi:hypothetical protein